MHHFLVTFDDHELSIFERFIVVEIPFGENIRYVLEGLYASLPPEERGNVSIILRPGVKFQLSRAFIEEAVFRKLYDAETLAEPYEFLRDIIDGAEKAFERFKTHGIYVLASEDYGHFVTCNINASAINVTDMSDAKVTMKLLKEIQNAEIDHLITMGGCKLPYLGSRYYRAPSGRYMKAFLRVGNPQTSRSAIDALFFWLIPYLRNCIGIITDTWSISSISQNASRRLVDYEEENKSPCPIEMLGDYHDQSEYYGASAAEKLDRFISRIEARSGRGVGQVLVLISATHTGSMVELIKRYMGIRGISEDKVTFVSLFKLSPVSEMPTLRDLSWDKDFSVVEEISEEQKSSAIQIHSTLYFPISPVSIEKSLLLKIIRPYGEFARRYSDISFARVHKTDSDSNPLNSRHHAIWIDTGKLINHPTFAKLFQDKLLALDPPPCLIIHPGHAAATSLVKLAEEIFTSSGQIVKTYAHNDLKLRPDLSHADEEIFSYIENLDGSTSILLLDDAFITGTRISSYQKNLRDFGFSGTYYYVVAISRPESDRIWRDQRRAFLGARAPQSVGDALSRENVFDCVEKLILPYWEEGLCPWCAEGEAFARLREVQNAEPLHDVSQGMERDIFIVPHGYSSLELKRDSHVGPAGLAQSNVFCVMAGALQSLRTEQIDGTPLLGDQYFLIKPVLNESYYLRYFTDSVLMAAIFRGAMASELVFSERVRERRRTRAIRNYLRTRSSEDLACEIAFAEARGKFPELEDVDASIVSKYKKICSTSNGSIG